MPWELKKVEDKRKELIDAYVSEPDLRFPLCDLWCDRISRVNLVTCKEVTM